ncbi:hypothetical protein [Nocardioides sp.]|uniref:hypothetical protein n=1 Tax=Nocardioides sp. TaxID=35761 RepID=UPI002ED8833E
MTHDPDPRSDPAPAEEQVRRLLADARHTEPMPEDVVARLDGVLADLAARPAEEPAPRPGRAERVADLAAARRRRTVRNLLVAAAAVVLIGVGLDRVDLSAGDADSATSAGGSAESADRYERDELNSGEAPQGAVPNDSDLRGVDGALALPPVRLSPERFGTQVRRLQDEARVSALDSRSYTAGKSDLARLDAAACPTDAWGSGRFVVVRYDGALGALVYRRVHGDTQVVDLFLCGSDEPARSVTLPVP